MECKKCSYFEAKREITNSGKVVVGFCKLRNKHISDLNIRKEFCKDRATVDIPAGEKTTPIKPEPSLYTDKEKEMLSRAQKAAASAAPKSASPTFAELAAKKGLADVREKPSNYAIGQPNHAPLKEVLLPSNYTSNPEKRVTSTTVPSSSRVEIHQGIIQQVRKKSAKPENVQIVPPMKLNTEDAIRLLEQQQSGKVKASFSKYGIKTSNSDAEKDLIRKAVWGGGT